jgi:hypothetical protein
MICRILFLIAFLPFITKAQFQDHHQNRAISAKEKQLVIDSLIHCLHGVRGRYKGAHHPSAGE